MFFFCFTSSLKFKISLSKVKTKFQEKGMHSLIEDSKKVRTVFIVTKTYFYIFKTYQ